MAEKNSIKNRFELVFLYDVRDANPNGDPDNSNMPRRDDETGQNIVTDVRLKRTIRDYWLKNEESVLIKPVIDDEGNRKSMEDLALEFLGIDKVKKKESGNIRAKLINELPERYLDVRAFGGTIVLSGANVSITGPAQFGLGRSLNIPEIKTHTITASLASKSSKGGEGKGQGTIGEYHILDYSLISFHGLISEITAEETKFAEEDLDKLFEGMWLGTKQLNTRSKFNHNPRLLISVKYNEDEAQIGDLDLGLSLENDEGLKKLDDVSLDITGMLERLKKYSSKVDSIKILWDSDLKVMVEGKAVDNIIEVLKKELEIEDISELNLGSDGE